MHFDFFKRMIMQLKAKFAVPIAVPIFKTLKFESHGKTTFNSTKK
jgi:hypothetical protein